MTAATHVAIINHSARVSNTAFRTMCRAVRKQALDYGPKAGLRMPVVTEYGTPPETLPAHFVPIRIFDDADVANALGYHDVDQDTGVPYGRVFAGTVLDAGGSLLGETGDPALAVSTCLSHEFGEWRADAWCTAWTDISERYQVATENADPVQGDAYFIDAYGTHVAVSNLLLPEWFNMASKAPSGAYDLMGKLHAPLTATPGGYWIIRDLFNRGKIGQQFFRVADLDELPPLATGQGFRHASMARSVELAPIDATKHHPASRTYRRLGGAFAGVAREVTA